MPEQVAAITLHHVSRTYGDVAALSDVTVRIEPGQRVALVGHSGSGKSTLLRQIGVLERPDAGAVGVLGQQTSGLRGRALRALRSEVGFVFQHYELVGCMTVLENVLTGALARLRGPRLGLACYPKALRLSALAQLERVGMEAFLYQRTDTLSGGQRQRVTIARALMQQPRILLADEPVASLDPRAALRVLDLMTQVSARDNLTVVCSLHQVDAALSWAQRIVGLESGKVVMDAPTTQVTRADLLDLYGQDPPPVPDAVPHAGTETRLVAPRQVVPA